MSNYFKSNWKIVSFLFFVGIISRIPFLEKFQSHWDGPDYSMAIIHYSFVEKTPTEPGYPLYIAFGRLLHFFISDIHLSILAVSVFFAGVGAALAFIAGNLIFNKKVGIITSLLFLSSPTLYYFGITANPYGILFSTSTLLALIVSLIVLQNRPYGIYLGFVLAFAIGIRPQDSMFLFWLGLYGFYYLTKKEKIKTIVSFLLFFTLWFVPTANAVGGIKNYLSYVLNFASHDTLSTISLPHTISVLPILTKGLFLTLTFSTLFLVYYPSKLSILIKKRITKHSRNEVRLVQIFLVWIIPSLLFNLLIRSDHAAHQMAYLTALLFLTSFAIFKLFEKRVKVLIFFVVLCVVLNLITFFRDRDVQNVGPYVSQSYHYSEIIKNDLRVPAILRYVRVFSPTTTLIIVDPEIFRPISYYLKDYKVYAFSALDVNISSFSNTVHYSYFWHYKMFSYPSHSFEIPSGIKTIILIPNNKQYLFSFIKFKKVMLENKAFIYELSTKPKTILIFKAHSIEKKI